MVDSAHPVYGKVTPRVLTDGKPESNKLRGIAKMLSFQIANANVPVMRLDKRTPEGDVSVLRHGDIEIWNLSSAGGENYMFFISKESTWGQDFPKSVCVLSGSGTEGIVRKLYDLTPMQIIFGGYTIGKVHICYPYIYACHVLNIGGIMQVFYKVNKLSDNSEVIPTTSLNINLDHYFVDFCALPDGIILASTLTDAEWWTGTIGITKLTINTQAKKMEVSNMITTSGVAQGITCGKTHAMINMFSDESAKNQSYVVDVETLAVISSLTGSVCGNDSNPILSSASPGLLIERANNTDELWNIERPSGVATAIVRYDLSKNTRTELFSYTYPEELFYLLPNMNHYNGLNLFVKDDKELFFQISQGNNSYSKLCRYDFSNETPPSLTRNALKDITLLYDDGSGNLTDLPVGFSGGEYTLVKNISKINSSTYPWG